MDLRDLAGQQGPAPRPAQPASPTSQGLDTTGWIWIVVQTEVFDGEDVLVVRHRRDLDDARAAHPDLVVYLMSEIELMYGIRDDTDHIKTIHMVKKKVGGWVRSLDEAPFRKEAVQ